MAIKQARGMEGWLKPTEFKAEKRAMKEQIDDIVLDKLNETQLWFLYLGLERLSLEPDLQIGVNDMARRIKAYGVRKYKWNR